MNEINGKYGAALKSADRFISRVGLSESPAERPRQEPKPYADRMNAPNPEKFMDGVQREALSELYDTFVPASALSSAYTFGDRVALLTHWFPKGRVKIYERVALRYEERLENAQNSLESQCQDLRQRVNYHGQRVGEASQRKSGTYFIAEKANKELSEAVEEQKNVGSTLKDAYEEKNLDAAEALEKSKTVLERIVAQAACRGDENLIFMDAAHQEHENESAHYGRNKELYDEALKLNADLSAMVNYNRTVLNEIRAGNSRQRMNGFRAILSDCTVVKSSFESVNRREKTHMRQRSTSGLFTGDGDALEKARIIMRRSVA